MSYVEVKHINKHFGSFKALEDISFSVEKGELLALLGPSGSGKTTILRTIAGLERADSGDVIINGQVVNDLPGSKRGIGFVFQNYALFRYMTVYDNIAFGLKVLKLPKTEISQRVHELIELVGLAGLEKRYPNELSGGQRQRVAFARAFAPKPNVLLLDEPFAAIDAKVRQELRQWLRQIVGQLNITSIFVTHDQDEALEVSDRIIVMDQGRIEQIGKPVEIYSDPASSFVARFASTSPAVQNYGALAGFEEVPGYPDAIIRPEFVEAFKPDNEKFTPLMPASCEGTVTGIFFRGTHLEVSLDVCGMSLSLRRSLERRPIEIGERMRVVVYRLFALGKDGSIKQLTNAKLPEGANLMD